MFLPLILLLIGLPAFSAPPQGETSPDSKRKVQVALLLDTSNSMDGLINQAKATLWDLVNEFAYVRCQERKTPTLEIALYEYGNDGLSAQEGYIRQVLPFTSDLDELSAQLFSLKTNGGEEYCGAVIGTAMRQLQWSKDRRDLKLLFIAGNEPFNQGRTPYESVLEQARERDVTVNTIFCGDYQLGIQTLWADGAQLGKGQYTAIDHNQAIVHVATPYDEVIIRLNRGLNKTYIGYGRQGAAKLRAQAVQDVNAEEMEEGVLVARAVSKSSGFYQNSHWDLVDAHAEKKVDVSDLSREQLPDSLRALSPAALKSELESLMRERRQLQAEIRQANEKREAYLQSHAQNQESTLQEALIQAVRRQASAKDFSWIQ